MVEIEGGQHGTDDAPADDARRDACLRRSSFKTLRSSNRAVITGLDAALDMFSAALAAATPTSYPSPLGGE